MDLKAIAEKLQTWADELRQAQADVCLPRQDYTLKEASEKVRAACGDKYIVIQPPSLHWHSGRDSKPEFDEWQVYDGQDRFRGKTLAQAVNQALEANRPTEEQTPEVVETYLAGEKMEPAF